MNLSGTPQFETTIFRFLKGDDSVEAFEQWIYATPELESCLGKGAYEQLLSFNYHQPAARHDLGKILLWQIDLARYYTWELKQYLTDLLNETGDPMEILQILCSKFEDGYGFLGNTGFAYLNGLEDVPRLKEQNLWHADEFNRRRQAVNDVLSTLRTEIEDLIRSLETGDIIIIDEHTFQRRLPHD